MSFFDYVILFVVLGWFAAAVCYLIKQKMAGQHAGGGCSGCAGCARRCRVTHR
jgi:hypothetical protein